MIRGMRVSASQVAAAQNIDAISILPGMAQVHLSKVVRLWRLLEKERPHAWKILPPSRRPKLCSSIEEPVVRLKRILVRSPTGRIAVERKLEEVLFKHSRETVPTWECLDVH